MPQPSRPLRATLRVSPRLAARRLWGVSRELRLADVAAGTALGAAAREALRGRAVLLRTESTLTAAVALIELDGLARRIVICPPDLNDDDLPGVAATAGVEAAVLDAPTPAIEGLNVPLAPVGAAFEPLAETPADNAQTEWVMFTSGTTGAPKMVVHTLEGLTGAIRPPAAGSIPPVWGTFYDTRRYGGLQILLRALVGEGSMALAEPGEPLPDQLARFARLGVTHLTGTPSHWRRVMMSRDNALLSPSYVRLSGEIADQAVLDALKARFPSALIGHAYASTEAGVGFEVNDGLEGFPTRFVDQQSGEVEMRVVDGSLRLRSRRTATAYLNADQPPLVDAEGFVDSGDMVERRGDRFHFVGRRGGIINVGGLKVSPEEIEAVINRHPAVRAALVKGRRNPITGAIVVAEVVLADAANDEATVKAEILSACRRDLAPHKVPAGLRFVPALAMTAGGKLERAGA
jgi:acyl-coenzyme A synthetase/AMP-(fatty) acid ligase